MLHIRRSLGAALLWIRSSNGSCDNIIDFAINRMQIAVLTFLRFAVPVLKLPFALLEMVESVDAEDMRRVMDWYHQRWHHGYAMQPVLLNSQPFPSFLFDNG